MCAGETEERGSFRNPVIPESASRLSGTLRRDKANALHSPRFEGQANALHSPREGPSASAGLAASRDEMGSGEKGGDRPRLNPFCAYVRNDRHGHPVGRVTTRQCGAYGPAGYAPRTRPTDCGTREAITTLTLQGHHALAEKVDGFLKQEQAALPTLTQWCHANGYGYYGEP